MASRNANTAYAPFAASSADTSDGPAGSTGAGVDEARAHRSCRVALNAARAAPPSAATSGGCQ